MIEITTLIAFLTGLGLIPSVKLTSKLAKHFWLKASNKAAVEIDELFDEPIKVKKAPAKKTSKVSSTKKK